MVSVEGSEGRSVWTGARAEETGPSPNSSHRRAQSVAHVITQKGRVCGPKHLDLARRWVGGHGWVSGGCGRWWENRRGIFFPLSVFVLERVRAAFSACTAMKTLNFSARLST